MADTGSTNGTENGTGVDRAAARGAIHVTNTGGNVTIGDHNTVTSTVTGAAPDRDPRQEALLQAIRKLRADLGGIVPSEQTAALDGELADAEEEIEDLGRADTARLTRLRRALTDAGMSTGHILYHFGKKDRLLLEVLAWSQRDLWDRFQQAVDQAASPAEKLDLFVRFYLPRHQGDERYALWTQVLAQRHDDAGRAVLTELLDGWDARLAAILREGRDLGHFADVDLTEFTIRAVAMLSGLSEDVMFGRSRWQHASAHAFALTALERELRPAGQG